MAELTPYTGETIDEKDDRGIRGLLLDYGWTLPIAAGAAYGIAKGIDYFKGPPDDNPPNGPKSKSSVESRALGKAKDVVEQVDYSLNRPVREGRDIPLDTSSYPGTPAELEKALGQDWEKAIRQSAALRNQRQAEARQHINQDMQTPTAPPPVDKTPEQALDVLAKTGEAPTNGLPSSPDPQADTPKILAPQVPPSEPKPTVGQAAETIAPILNEASAQPAADIPAAPAQGETTTPTAKAKPGRKTKEEKAAILAKQGAIVPPPGSQQIPENWGKGMGWLTGRFGVEGAQQFIDQYNKGQPFGSYDEFQKVWKDLTGKTPGVQGQIYGPSYSDVPSDVRKSRGISPVAPQYNTNLKPGYAIPVEPGTKTPKGSANLSGLLGMLGMGGLMYMGTTPESQAAMQRAESAIRDIGVSPNIFEGKGEEMGRLGTSLVSAGNPNYRRDLYDQMKFESDPGRYEILMKEYRKAGGNVPGGRGIAPPSAYMR